VATVIPGSGADRGGIRVGDVLLKFAGKEIHKFTELPSLVQRRRPGEKVEVELRRGTETMKFQVTLGQREAGADQ
jgi:serine protease Do